MLTARQVDAAKGRAKDYKLSDAGGLHLYVTTKGHRSWRFKYRFGGKEKRIVLGAYPEMSLAEARTIRDDARRLLREHRDPATEARKRKLASIARHENTFEKLARRWHADQKDRWKPVHANDVITGLERDIFPALGQLPIADIDEPTLLAVLKRVEKRGAVETAHRQLQRVSAIFKYAKGAGAGNGNPAADMKGSLKPVPPKRRWPALTKVEDIRGLIATVDGAGASPVTRLASRFMGLTAQRPGMIRSAPWTEFHGIADWQTVGADAPEAVWRIPAERMKQELELRDDEAFDHEVPLSRDAVEVLRVVRRLTGRGPLPFCSARSAHDPLSENTVGYLYNRLGYKGRHVPHGWRSAFSTIMNHTVERAHLGSDRLVIDRLIIDLMLAHMPSGLSESERKYNRAAYMERRRELFEAWAGMIMQGQRSVLELLEGPRRPRSHSR